MIRDATAEDKTTITQVYIDSWRAAYKTVLPDQLMTADFITTRGRWWLDDIPPQTAGRQMIVYDHDGRVVGFAGFGPANDEDVGVDTAELYVLYLLESAWGEGYGRSLLRELLRRLQKSYRQVVLWTLQDNRRAISFYETMGFQTDERFRLHALAGARIREDRYRYTFS